LSSAPAVTAGVRIGASRYAELRDAPAAAPVPAWLASPARAAWDLDVAGRTVGDTIMIRPETGYGYARASYELNLGCNYDCERCYLGDKQFAGLDWPGRERPAAAPGCPALRRRRRSVSLICAQPSI